MVKPTVISLFAGCGGSSSGYRMAGYQELLAVEYDENAVKTFKLNFPDVLILKKDITKLSSEEILDLCKIKTDDLDVLDGSPPCQGFSTAGKREICDPRNDLIKHYIRLVNEIQPKVFIMENVSGMVKGKMKGLFIEYLKKMKALNYEVKVKLLNAKYYDVPQSRQRLIFIGVRKDLNLDPVFPEPSKKIITVKEALNEVNNKTFTSISKREKQQWLKAKQGESVGLFSCVKKLYWNKPAYTNRFRNPPYHPFEVRKLTIEEGKRLQSFPDDFKFIGKFEEQWARIGNSVPPLMMKAIAETIRKEILEQSEIEYS